MELSRFPEIIKLIKADRDNSCEIMTGNKVVRLVNYNRYIVPVSVSHSDDGLNFGAGQGGRQQSPPGTAPGM